MGTVPDPIQDISGALVKAPPWLDLQKDYTETKKTAVNLSSTVSGMKADITLLKMEFAGLTVASLGYAAIKIDEKGLTVMGRQIRGWKLADPAKHFQLKMEKFQRKLNRRHAKVKRRLDKVTAAQDAYKNAVSRRQDAEARVPFAEKRHRQGKESDEWLAKVKEKARQARAEEKKARDALKDITKSAARIEKKARTFMRKAQLYGRKEERAKNRFKTAAKATTKDVNSLRTALRQAAQEA
ncbi:MULTISPECIES: hypothetical protein [unclassified Streptomyces]|uniref:hypothetical protein n=1 Tax=unclassified Streptomyces TaxID=2593676 RepID=UPI002E3037AE|nr:hypothetical protein [Streptomyces sp. NBC_01268]